MKRRSLSVRLVVLHGSRARGQAHGDSDWDLGVLSDRALTAHDKLRLMDDLGLELEVAPERIDILDLSTDAPLINYRVAMEGRLLRGHTSDWEFFRLRAWKAYLNNQKMFELRTKWLERVLP